MLFIGIFKNNSRFINSFLKINHGNFLKTREFHKIYGRQVIGGDHEKIFDQRNPSASSIIWVELKKPLKLDPFSNFFIKNKSQTLS